MKQPSEIVPVGPHDHRAQREWEHYQVAKGIERYRQTLQKVHEDGRVTRRGLQDLEPGQVIAKELIGPLVERIRQAQQAPMEKIGTRLTLSDAEWGLSLLPAETLAAVTVLHALSRAEPGPFTACAIALGTRVQHEWEYQNWKAAEAAAEKERKQKDPESQVPNLFKLMLARNNRQINERIFAKWKKKAPLFCAVNWTTNLRAHIGSVLLGMLVESNAWFEVVVERVNMRQTRIFRMTELGMAWVADRHQQNELMRPYLLPMICEPLDYDYSGEAHPQLA
ncbi:hypothetical protein IS481_11940 [Caldimonas thermodepolymerans]|uniref:hypothetical protein n=1 Tax=Caldimonas thermodepolymerans TaxID=215580 RepID=UPI001475521A|nr:hypothetical protein [Caldimonas thermodepolymerans]QPC30480.1 hypothetical protein IS481_11940 [Caldimonas thermodepolymerans]